MSPLYFEPQPLNADPGQVRQAGNLADADLGGFGRELASWREARHSIPVDRLLISAMDRCG